MKVSSRARLLSAIAALLFAVMMFGCAGGDDGPSFFRGKKVTIIVPHGPGGMDTYARAIAPYLQKYLPGSKVEIANDPGAGGLQGRNQVYAAAPDGLTLGFTTSAGTLLAEWAEQTGLRYKTADFAMIGRINAEAHTMVVAPRTGFSSMGNIIRAGKIRMGFAGVSSDDYYIGMITMRLLGIQAEAHTQFTSSVDAGLACVRGEVDAILFADSTVHPLITAKTAIPVVVFGETRLGSIPAVPTIFEVTPADKKELIKALVRIYGLERTLFAPPGLPPSRLKTLREALDRTIADPEFQLGMLAVQRPVSYLSGAETDALLKDVLAYKDDIAHHVLEIAQGAK
ncbi:MAG: tripartite tricarboxylate transporter substrate-binding protein [Spirochaetota bacterium]